MIDKNGYEFEFAEKETGFVEEATALKDIEGIVRGMKRVAAYGKAPDKRAIHHNNRGQKSVRGEK